MNARNDQGQCALTLVAARSFNKGLEIIKEAAEKTDPTGGNLPPLSHIQFDIRSLKISTLKLLLRTGLKINVNNQCFNNTLTYYIVECKRQNNRLNKDICVLLFTAGEIVTGPVVEGTTYYCSGIVRAEVPEYLFHKELQMCLKHLCREAIRNHLLELDPHTHLFSRIPRLELPSSINDYLLYNQTLDDDEQTTSAGAASIYASAQRCTQTQIYFQRNEYLPLEVTFKTDDDKATEIRRKNILEDNVSVDTYSGGSSISPGGGRQLPGGGRQPIIWPIFPENCMKIKKFWARGGGRVPCNPM